MLRYKTYWHLIIISSLLSVLLCACAHSKHHRTDIKTKGNFMQTFSYHGININYLQCGTGEPILLLHGFGASTYSWRYIVDGLCEDYKIIAIDLKGFGLSDKPTDNKYTVRDQSEMVMAFIHQYRLNNVTLVGHSFGGAVALFTYLEMMQSIESTISKMILLDSASYNQEFPYFISILRTPILNRISLTLLPDKVNTRMILKKAFYDDSKITEEMTEVYASYLDTPGAYHALIATAKQIVPSKIETITHRYKDINIPVLLVWGENDEIVPLSIGRSLSEEIPKAELRVIRGCGHVPQEECPKETIGIIKSFLANCKGGNE